MNQIRKTLESVDALIIANPDFRTPFMTGEFIESIVFSTIFTDSLSKPVIPIPYTSKANYRHIYPREVLDIWIPLANSNDFNSPSNLMLSISIEAGVPLSDLRVAYEGIFFNRCVGSFAKRTSTIYHGPEVGNLGGSEAEEKAYEGFVIESACLK
ncbi:hypothetical protein HQ533_06240 [Candidatus Woesearchaeota archaeon]|nr:hypothetical protein [Candidatus Woesearchaeota archaeon]